MPMTDSDRLRSLLGETIPADGSEEDTLFSTAQIFDMIDRAGGDVEQAAYEGWRYKMAHYANLVNTAEGSSRRDMSDLHDHARHMVEHFGGIAGVVTATANRTRIGKIVRS